MFWFYVLPLGFLLTMYTVTGYDASAHVSEETQNASVSAAKGVWQSVFYSAIIGWFVLLAITFAVGDVKVGNEAAGYAPARSSTARHGLLGGEARHPHRARSASCSAACPASRAPRA